MGKGVEGWTSGVEDAIAPFQDQAGTDLGAEPGSVLALLTTIRHCHILH